MRPCQSALLPKAAVRWFARNSQLARSAGKCEPFGAVPTLPCLDSQKGTVREKRRITHPGSHGRRGRMLEPSLGVCDDAPEASGGAGSTHYQDDLGFGATGFQVGQPLLGLDE
jgi:hypothetical protein